MDRRAWRLEFSFQALSLAITFDCDVSVLVVPQKGPKKECELTSFSHKRQPMLLDKKLALEVEAEEGRPFLLTFKVLVRARGSKKCAGEVELQLLDYLRSRNANFRHCLPLGKCPDKKATLSFEFRYSPLAAAPPAREPAPKLAFPSLCTSKRDESTNSSRRLRSASPSNVQVFFSRASVGAAGTAKTFNFSGLTNKSANISLSLRDAERSPTPTIGARATFPLRALPPQRPALTSLRPAQPAVGSARVILDQSLELPGDLSPLPCSGLAAANLFSELRAGSADTQRSALAAKEEQLQQLCLQLREREAEVAGLRAREEEGRAAAELARRREEERGSCAAELQQALRLAEEKLAAQTDALNAQLEESAASRLRDAQTRAALEASARQLEITAFELKARHFREAQDLQERACRLEYELSQAIAQRDAGLARLEEERGQLRAEKKSALDGLKAELAQKMGVCSCSQNSLGDLTVEDFAQQLRSVEARGDALRDAMEALRAEKVGVEQKLAVCEEECARLSREMHRQNTTGQAEIALLSQLLQAERETSCRLSEQQRQTDSLSAESELKIPQLAAQLQKTQEELDCARAQLAEASSALARSRGEGEDLRALLARKELEGDDYSLLISQNDLMKKKVRTLEHKLDDSAAKAARLGQVEKLLEQREKELDRLRQESASAIQSLQSDAEQLRERLDVRKSSEFISMEKKYIAYVQKMTDVLNLVQNLRLNKEHQESIIKLLI